MSEVEDRHQPIGRVTHSGVESNWDICRECETPMPCDVRIVLDMLAAERERADAPPAPPAARHEYDGACRNVQHAATGKCRCNHVSNGRRCGLSRMAPIHAAAGQGE